MVVVEINVIVVETNVLIVETNVLFSTLPSKNLCRRAKANFLIAVWYHFLYTLKYRALQPTTGG